MTNNFKQFKDNRTKALSIEEKDISEVKKELFNFIIRRFKNK